MKLQGLACLKINKLELNWEGAALCPANTEQEWAFQSQIPQNSSFPQTFSMGEGRAETPVVPTPTLGGRSGLVAGCFLLQLREKLGSNQGPTGFGRRAHVGPPYAVSSARARNQAAAAD